MKNLFSDHFRAQAIAEYARLMNELGRRSAGAIDFRNALATIDDEFKSMADTCYKLKSALARNDY